MKNPKDFQATPVSRWQPIDKSATGSGDLKHNGTRTEKKTSPTHFKTTDKSSTGRGELAHNATRKSVQTPVNHFKPTPHSAPGVPVAPKKWHKKYSLDSQLGSDD